MADSEDIKQIKECLLYKDYIGVKTFILEQKFSDENKFWELLTDLATCITQENLENCPGFFQTCERCMAYIVNRGNPKEIILALLEQADSFHENAKYLVLLPLIQKALMKLPSKRQFSLELAVDTLYAHLEGIGRPKDLDLEGDEKRVQDLDPVVSQLNEALAAFLDFLSPFVEEVSIDSPTPFKGENRDRLVQSLLNYLLFTLDHPLVGLDLTFDHKAERPVKSNSRVCVEKVISLLLKLRPNFHSLILATLKHNAKLEHEKRRDLPPEGDDQLFMRDDKPVPLLSLACLSYMVQCQRLGIEHYTWILPSEHVLEFNLQFVLALLRRKESMVQTKGVELLQALVDRIETGTLPNQALEKPDYFRTLDSLFDVMIHCPVKDTRQACVQMLPYFIKMFDMEGRYRVFVKILGTCSHAGAAGYCIQLLKNQIDEILCNERDNSTFFSLSLLRLLEQILLLPEGPASDLLEQSDKIISALNFIRYMVLRDPKGTNLTGIWNYLSDIQKYQEDLRTGLEMSKGHYKLELSLLEEGSQGRGKPGAGDEDDVEMSLSVAGVAMPKMPRGQRMEIMRQALNTFDMIDIVLSRVNELVW